MSDLDLDHRFEKTDFLIEATSFESLEFWKKNHTTLAWKQDSMGCGYLMGYVDKLPVMVNFFWQRIRGKLIAFYDTTSRMVDHKTTTAWMNKHLSHIPRIERGVYKNEWKDQPPSKHPCFAKTAFLVEASERAELLLIEDFSDQFLFAYEDATWFSLGRVGNRPVNLHISWWKVNDSDKLVAFYRGESDIVDYSMIECWFEQHCMPMCDNGYRRAKTDAGNFGSFARSIFGERSYNDYLDPIETLARLDFDASRAASRFEVSRDGVRLVNFTEGQETWNPNSRHADLFAPPSRIPTMRPARSRSLAKCAMTLLSGLVWTILRRRY